MAAGASTFARHVAGGLVRELWPNEALIEEVIQEDPVLGLATKETDWSHEVRHHPLGWGANQGIGRTYGDAKRTKGTASEAEFQIGTREMYASLSLQGKLLRVFEYTKQKALLVDPIKREGEATIDRMRRRFCATIHGNGVGVIGRISAGSNVATDTITLDSANDLKNFEDGRVLQAESTGATGGTLKGNGAEAVVLSIGTEDNPTVTLSVPWSTAIPGIAAGDRLYGTGTYDDDYFYGLDAFLPLHTGASGANPITTFLTCPRARNPGWLGGRCMTGTNLSVYQRIKKAARIAVDAGGKPDIYLLSTRNFEKFEFEMDNKLVMTKEPAADVGKYKLGISYTGAVVQGPRGPIKVMPSMWMPDNVERIGEQGTLVMGSIGPLVHWDDGNGPKDMRTEDSTDNRELRAVSDPAFLVKKPGAWVRVAV
jgi:hypothetical protein